jgi:accessory colonization factor AcfC
MTEHKRLRPQGDHLESRTSIHKDVSKRTQEKCELRETIRKLRKKFEAYANAQADVLRRIATNKNIKNWTLWRGRPLPKQKKGTGPYGRNWW